MLVHTRPYTDVAQAVAAVAGTSGRAARRPACDSRGGRASPEEVMRLRRQLAHQETVLAITRSFASAPTLDQLLLTVAEQVCAAIRADRATFFLVDHRSRTVWSRSTNELEMAEIRIPLGIGVAGHVGATGDVLNVPDCTHHPMWAHGKGPEIDRATGYHTRSMLVMPVRSGAGGAGGTGGVGGAGQVIGVFQIINKLRADGTLAPPHARTWPRFTDDDVTLMESVAASAAIAVQNAYLAERTKRMFTSTVQVLATTLERRNPETAGHSRRVATIAEILARQMGLAPMEVDKIRYAGLLHDVGKIGVPEAVLTKDGPLTDAEYAQIKRHAAITREILSEIEFLEGYEDLPLVAAQHHEKLNGHGYPLGEAGDHISVGGRLLAVADIYDALRQHRVYKPSMPPEQTLGIVREARDRGDLDPLAVALLERHVDEIERACAPLRPASDEPPAEP